jgi:hypothetical protein
MMERVQKPSNSVCHLPTSEPFRIIFSGYTALNLAHCLNLDSERENRGCEASKGLTCPKRTQTEDIIKYHNKVRFIVKGNASQGAYEFAFIKSFAWQGADRGGEGMLLWTGWKGRYRGGATSRMLTPYPDF